MKKPIKIIDGHVHFFDNKVNQYNFLEKADPVFTNFIGDYSTLPREYLLEDYLKEADSYEIEGIVWQEWASTDPLKEAEWANSLVDPSIVKQVLTSYINFLDPNLESKLDFYQSLSHVTAVRERLMWDFQNPMFCLAQKPNLLKDSQWLKNLKLLSRYSFHCELAIFSKQLGDLKKVISSHPNINFIIPVMAWPQDISKDGFDAWKKSLKEIAQDPNVCFQISGIECIFGRNWTVEQVQDWILTAIETFGTQRCMFCSHMPIATLSKSFNQVYQAYEKIVSNFSEHEKNDLFHEAAAKWFIF